MLGTTVGKRSTPVCHLLLGLAYHSPGNKYHRHAKLPSKRSTASVGETGEECWWATSIQLFASLLANTTSTFSRARVVHMYLKIAKFLEPLESRWLHPQFKMSSSFLIRSSYKKNSGYALHQDYVQCTIVLQNLKHSQRWGSSNIMDSSVLHTYSSKEYFSLASWSNSDWMS